MDAELLPVTLACADRGAVFVRPQDLLRALDVEPRFGDGAQQHLVVARVLAARVVGGEERVLEGSLAAAGLLARPVQEAVRVEGVPDALPVAEREADLCAALAQDGVAAWWVVPAAVVLVLAESLRRATR